MKNYSLWIQQFQFLTRYYCNNWFLQLKLVQNFGCGGILLHRLVNFYLSPKFQIKFLPITHANTAYPTLNALLHSTCVSRQSAVDEMVTTHLYTWRVSKSNKNPWATDTIENKLNNNPAYLCNVWQFILLYPPLCIKNIL